MGWNDKEVELDHSDYGGGGPKIDWYRPNRPEGKDFIKILTKPITWKHHGYTNSVGRYGGTFNIDHKYPGWSDNLPDGVRTTTKYILIVWVIKSFNKDGKENTDLRDTVLPWTFSWKTKNSIKDKQELFDPFNEIIRVKNTASSDTEANWQNVELDRVDMTGLKVPPDLKERMEETKQKVIEYMDSIDPETAKFFLFGPNLSDVSSENNLENSEIASGSDVNLDAEIQAILA
jgi:hypothetical protein